MQKSHLQLTRIIITQRLCAWCVECVPQHLEWFKKHLLNRNECKVEGMCSRRTSICTYIYLAMCMIFAVRCVIIIGLYWLFYNYSTYVFNILFMFVSVFRIFVFYFVYSVLLYCFVYCFSFCIQLSFSYFIQVYHPMPLGRNPLALSKYNTILCPFN
jgi:hypothetical protein